MTDFVSELKNAIQEEINDHHKYLSIAEIAPEKYAPIIRDIAAEEESHKKHLHKILEDCGCDLGTLEDSVAESKEPVSEKKIHKEAE